MSTDYSEDTLVEQPAIDVGITVEAFEEATA